MWRWDEKKLPGDISFECQREISLDSFVSVLFDLEETDSSSGFFYGASVDIENTAEKSEDQSGITTGTKNNSRFDKYRGVLEKGTDQNSGKKSDSCPSKHQNRKKNGNNGMFSVVILDIVP